MFKQIIAYRISDTWECTLEQVEEALSKNAFQPCGATQESSKGFVPPRLEENGALVESIDSQWIMRFMVESKVLPGSVLARKVNEKAVKIEQETGRKPGKKEKRELKDEARLDLLPMAFTKLSTALIWIDREARMLLLDVASQSKADEIVTCLVESLQGFAVALVDTQQAPQACMAHWLQNEEPPVGFSLDREVELKSADEAKSVVRYSRHPLELPEIREHISQGKLPIKLAMSWDDRISFVLTEGTQIKKLTLLDTVFEGQKSEDASFDADVAIFTGEMRKFLPELWGALGGFGRAELGGAPAKETADAQ